MLFEELLLLKLGDSIEEYKELKVLLNNMKRSINDCKSITIKTYFGDTCISVDTAKSIMESIIESTETELLAYDKKIKELMIELTKNKED